MARRVHDDVGPWNCVGIRIGRRCRYLGSLSTIIGVLTKPVCCLINCYGYLKGPMDMYKLYEGKYNESIQAYALEQMGRRKRGEYTDGVPRIPVPSPSPEQWRNLK